MKKLRNISKRQQAILLVVIGVIALGVMVITGLTFVRLREVENFTDKIKIEKVAKKPKNYKPSQVSNDWQKIREAQKEAIENGLLENVYATLKISALDLELPIFRGANEHTLSLGAGTFLYDNQEAGQGNFVISGHTTPYTGVLFTDLHQLKTGETITVETATDTFLYRIDKTIKDDKYFVTVDGIPEDDILKEPKENETPRITLITCSSWQNDSERLLIGGTLIK